MVANPQPDQYTKISNEIIEALARIRIPGEAMQVLWVVFRKTYGWNKKADRISMSQISEMTGLKRPTVARALKRLLEYGVIKKDNTVIQNDNIIINKLLFNKDYDQWNMPEKKSGCYPKCQHPVIKKDNTTVIQNDNKGVIQNDTYNKKVKESTKDTSTKEKNSTSIFGFEDVWHKYPRRVGKKEALRHFKATVKTGNDLNNIHKALERYLASKNVAKGYVQNGSTWFNDWETWIDYTEPVIKTDVRQKYEESLLINEERMRREQEK